MTKREGLIDYLRFIGIAFVVLGHTVQEKDVITVIYAFHIPLFFFLSGYLINIEKYKDKILMFTKSKAISLLIPYAFISIMNYWICSIYENEYYRFQDIIKALILGNGIGFAKYNIVMWFLPTLFISLVLFIFTQRFLFKLRIEIQLIIYLIMAILSFYLQNWSGKLWFSIDIAFIVIFFLFLGQVYKHYKKLFSNYYVVATSTILFCIGLYLNKHVDMNMRWFNNVYLYLITATSGIIITVFIMSKLKNVFDKFKLMSRFMQYVGKNSMIVYLLHIPSIFLSTRIYAYVLLSFNYLVPNFWEYWYILALIGLTIPLAINYFLIEKQYGKLFLIGKK